MKNSNLKLRRLLASLTDGLFMFVITAIVTVAPTVIFFKEYLNGNFVTYDFFWVIFSLFGSFALWILYLYIPTLIFKNATLGMKLNHLVFVNTREQETHLYTFLLREAMLVICIVASLGISLIADFISILSSENSRTFYDVFSSFKVVSLND